MKQALDTAAEMKEIGAIIAGIEKTNLFSVPENYFTQFPEKVLAYIQQKENIAVSAKDEIEILSPLLASLKNKSTLAIPGNYFEQFSFSPVTREEHEAALVTAPVRSISAGRKWIRYAAAAVITGIIGLTAFWAINKSTTNHHANAGNVAIQQHNNNQQVNDFSGIPDETLAKYLSATPAIILTPDSADSGLYDIAVMDIDEKKLANLLQEMPDEDLISYTNDTRDENIVL
ncbi:MAG: hypothetical protein QM763_16795 [Agriterribacter sp.]